MRRLPRTLALAERLTPMLLLLALLDS